MPKYIKCEICGDGTANVCRCADASESDCSELLVSAGQENGKLDYKLDIDGDINKGHFHELIDRTHIICSMLDDYVIDHPGMTEEMNKQCEIAQMALCKMQSLASAKQCELFPAN